MKPTRKDNLDLILDDAEKLAVQMFVDNEVQREAVKKVLLMGVYNNGVLKKGEKADPLKNFTLGLVANADELRLTNEDLGTSLRAQWEGIVAVENGFNGLMLYKTKTEDEKGEKENPAR